MDTRHLIEEFVFDLTFDSMAIARGVEPRLASWVSGELLPLIEPLLDKLSGAGEVLRFDSVEIDLGDVPYRNFEVEIALRLVRQLGEALRNKKAQLDAEPLGSASRLVGRRADFEQLENFLSSGSLPWQARSSETLAHEQLLERVLRQDSDKLIQHLSHSPLRSTLIKRLVQQFPEVHLATLLRRMKFARSELLLDLVDTFRKALDAPAVAGVGRAGGIDMLWEMLLEVLLAATSMADTVSVVKMIVERYAHSQAMDIEQMLAWLMTAATLLASENRIGAEFKTILATLANVGRKAVENHAAMGEKSIEPHVTAALLAKNSAVGGSTQQENTQTAYLFQLYEDLQSGKSSLHDLQLSETEMRRLVAVFVGRDPIGGIVNRTVFLRAIESHALRAVDKHAYFRLIMQRLLAHQLIDLEAILVESLQDGDKAGNIGNGLQLALNAKAQRGADGVVHHHIAANAEKNHMPESNAGAPFAHPVHAIAPSESEWMADEGAPVDATRPDIDVALTPLRYRLAQGLMKADVAEITALWDLLRHRQAGLVQQALRQYGKFARVRLQLAAQLPDSILKDFTHLLEPGADAIMATLSARSDLFGIGIGIGIDIADAGAEQNWPRRIWEYSLTHVLDEQNGAFDSVAYIDGLIRILLNSQPNAGSDNGPERVRATAQLWMNALAGSAPSVLKTSLDALLHAQEESVATSSQSLGVSGGDAVYESLRRHFTQPPAVFDTSATLDAALDVLAASYPIHMRRLLGLFQSGELTLRIPCLGSAQLRRLLVARLALIPSGVKNNADFLHEIDKLADLVFDRSDYFRRVLENMLQGKGGDPVGLLEHGAQRDDAGAENLSTARALALPSIDEERGRAPDFTRHVSSDGLEQPKQLLALWEKLQRGDLALERIHLNDIAMRRLVAVAIATDPANSLDNRGNFLRAIESYAERAIDKQRYFKDVLQNLLLKQLVDLEEILLRSRPSAVTAETGQPLSTREFHVDGIAEPVETETSRSESLPLLRERSALKQESNNPGKQTLSANLAQNINGNSTDSNMSLVPQQARLLQNPPDIQHADFGHITEIVNPVKPAQWTAENLAFAVRPLLSRDPEQFRWIFSELKSGQLAKVATHLNTAELQKLMDGYIALYAHSNATYRHDFPLAIDSHVKLTSRKKLFFQKILEQLLYQELVDLEAILLLCQTTDGAEIDHVDVGVEAKFAPVAADSASSGDKVGHSAEHNLILSLRQQLNLPASAEHNETLQDRAIYADDRIAVDSAARVDALAATQSEQWQQVFQDLQSGRLSLEKASLSGLQWLVAAFIALEATPDIQKRQNFLRAIEANAHNAKNQTHYFRLVLQGLMHNELIDLDAFVERSNAILANPVSVPDRMESAGTVNRYLPDSARAVVLPDQGNKLSIASALEQAVANDDSVALVNLMDSMVSTDTSWLRQELERTLSNGQFTARFVELLPETCLLRVLALLLGAEYADARRYADIVGDAVCFLSADVTQQQAAILKWQCVFKYFFVTKTQFAREAFLSTLLTELPQASGSIDMHALRVLVGQQTALPPQAKGKDINSESVLAKQGEIRSNPPSHAGLPTVMPSPPPASNKLNSSQSTSQSTSQDKEQSDSSDIHVGNAGQILVSPYLPRLFTLLDLMEKNAFIDVKAAERAVHLLQFMVNGQTESPEYQLVLNKQLCGIKTGVPIVRGIAISEREKQVIEELIQGMIQNWKAIGNTSVEGFRQSFLQRQGWLSMQDDAWQLRVQGKSFDMLLDQLPWNISMVMHPWMARPIHVKWR
jgi:hypothetical protein